MKDAQKNPNLKPQSEDSVTATPTSAHLSFVLTATDDDETRRSHNIFSDPSSNSRAMKDSVDADLLEAVPTLHIPANQIEPPSLTVAATSHGQQKNFNATVGASTLPLPKPLASGSFTGRTASSTVATSTLSNRRVVIPPLEPPSPKPPDPSFWRTTVKSHVVGETTRPQPPSVPVLLKGSNAQESGSSTKESLSVPHSTHSLPLVTPQDSQRNFAPFDPCDAITAKSSPSKNLFCAPVLLTIPHEHYPPSVSLPFSVTKSQPFQKSTIRVIAFQATAVSHVLSFNSRTSPHTRPTFSDPQSNWHQLSQRVAASIAVSHVQFNTVAADSFTRSSVHRQPLDLHPSFPTPSAPLFRISTRVQALKAPSASASTEIDLTTSIEELFLVVSLGNFFFMHYVGKAQSKIREMECNLLILLDFTGKRTHISMIARDEEVENFLWGKGDDNDAMLERLPETMKREWILVGATVVRNKLQKWVSQCVDTLALAGLKIRLLKFINIGFACSFLRQGLKQIFITTNEKSVSTYVKQAIKDTILLPITYASDMLKLEQNPYIVFALIWNGVTLSEKQARIPTQLRNMHGFNSIGREPLEPIYFGNSRWTIEGTCGFEEVQSIGLCSVLLNRETRVTGSRVVSYVVGRDLVIFSNKVYL